MLCFERPNMRRKEVIFLIFFRFYFALCIMILSLFLSVAQIIAKFWLFLVGKKSTQKGGASQAEENSMTKKQFLFLS